MDKRHLDKETNIINKFIEYKEFIKDKQVEFVIKKTERIVYGVYVLSTFIPRTEVLHRDLKRTGHTLLKLASRFADTTGIKSAQIDDIHANLQYLSSLLSLSCLSGYVSESNIEIFKSEINYLHKHIEELSTKTVSESQQMYVRQDMFVVGQVRHNKSQTTQHAPIKDKNTIPNQESSDIKDKLKPKHKHLTVSVKQPDLPKEDREERIIQVIKDKRIVSIKDISSSIFDCSEKTIQRTLQSLIDKGQIKKEGERRWAKYLLI